MLLVALLLVGASLIISNRIVSKVHTREKERATQWADAIRKKAELVRLTNQTFSQLRDKERNKMQLWIAATKEVSKPSALDINADVSFPFMIINQNNDIPVILIDNQGTVAGHINIDFKAEDLKQSYPNLPADSLNTRFEDSLFQLTHLWRQTNKPFTVEVYEDLFMTYYYSDSKAILRLENERDSLIQSFNDDLINNEGLVPVLLFNEDSNAVVGTNLDPLSVEEGRLASTIADLKSRNEPISISFDEGGQFTLYFDSSPELKQLQLFPFIQFFIIGLFVLIGYLIFSTFRKAEQNQVWAGMAKETAHQLGTPLSSLMAWIELLDQQGENAAFTREMRKDVKRLEKVTDRFSKIGSETKLNENDVASTCSSVIQYLRPRISDNVELNFTGSDELNVPHNAPLLEWVIENLVKNAVDAMESKGKVEVRLSQSTTHGIIEVEDNGKGLPAKLHKRIFEPGFSTKKRGWGLGLSLVKRIIKEYHYGKIYVAKSEPGKGTTFRIELPLKSV